MWCSATSVIEHIADDEEFLKQFELLLAPGGFGVLTCDFNDQCRPGDPLPVEDRRFYTRRDLQERLMPLIRKCQLVDQPRWSASSPISSTAAAGTRSPPWCSRR